ncbi:hypothetical protein LGV59_18320 [Bacteroides fragilis]|nr:hypothetical protein [Bacteroides fragilis]
MWELEKAGGKFDNFNSKQQKAIHELIDGLTEIPTKPNKDQYRVDNQSQYTKIVGRTYYNGEYALYAIQKEKQCMHQLHVQLLVRTYPLIILKKDLN